MGKRGFASKMGFMQALKTWKSTRSMDLDMEMDLHADDSDEWWSPRDRKPSAQWSDHDGELQDDVESEARAIAPNKMTRAAMLPQTPVDSDHETASEHSSDMGSRSPSPLPLPLPTTRLQSMLSVARRGTQKLLARQQSMRSNAADAADICESDFGPFAVDTPVWTRFGMGVVAGHREQDGVTIVRLQQAESATLYIGAQDDDCFAIPALQHDWVDTPVGQGRVLAFNAQAQVFAVRISGDLEFLAHVHRRHVRRVAPTRRTTFSGYNAYERQPSLAQTHLPKMPPTLQKGLSSAYQVIKTKSSGLSSTTRQLMTSVYYHNQCVLTAFGEGTILSLDHANARVQVQLVCGATAYLAMDAIQHYTKALVGMEVRTKYGMGTVESLRPADAIYIVRLYEPRAGESDLVFVHASDLVKSRRVRLGNMQRDVQARLERAKKSKLVAFAQSKAKLFARSNSRGGGAATTCRSASTRDLCVTDDFDVEPITAGI